MKTFLLFFIILPFFAYGHTPSCTLVTLVTKHVKSRGNEYRITLTDGTVWQVVDEEEMEEEKWVEGDHICFWKLPDSDAEEYRIINMDRIACVTVHFERRIN